MLCAISTLLYFLNLTLTYAYTSLSDSSLQSIPSPGEDFDIHTGSLLAPILKVRVPGTPAIEEVRQYFVSFFSDQLPNWKISLQNSTQKTILGGDPITFVNIIATRDPPWAQEGHVERLALVAHYDSKITPDGFIGATDSAAPCAMLLHAARSLDAALTAKWEAMEASGSHEPGLEEDRGLQILLLDGEEAFVTWTATDSLYGARALAQEWDESYNPAMSTYKNKLNSIRLFLLLDLLGAQNPRVPSYFRTTHWAYKNLASLEQRMRQLNVLKSHSSHPFLPESDKDKGQWYGGAIEDDHVPFMARGVEVLHIIPSPFPPVWHRMEDDGEHLDGPTVEDWALLTTAFAAEWMDLEGYMSINGKEGVRDHEASQKGKRRIEGIVKRDEL
jgi:hypothetical protein